MSETSLRRLYKRYFLEYASYVIKDRAIPDLADGLKPVQRRILWSLFQMDDGRFSKVANVIGHCMQFHPHGDRSIGDALVSLANRGFFIERQGNFGNIFTGDSASAARYIECRLTDLARETLFNKRITDFEPSYDGRNQEPVLLPAKLPVLLLLGAEGIAVGMSTKILPHNFQEVLKAQIACLNGKDFQLYPDFPQGGRIDVSDYTDGRGRIRNRARIEKDGNKNLIIRELPWGTTTESVVNSIELASNKGKIKISSIDDYTTDSVEINVRLSRGVGIDEGLKRLFAHTDCETVTSSNIVVIQDGTPVETTITEMIHYCTGRLIEILKLELRLEISDYTGRLHWLTLEQIFIENRLYKNIEECTTWNTVRDTVLQSLKPFTDEINLEVTEEDIDKLLSLKIRRISRFDIDSHKEEMGTIRKKMKKAKSNLRNIVPFAIDYLEKLLEKYGKNYPRLTSIEDFSDIDVKKVAIRNLKAGFNSDTGLFGTSIKGDRTFSVSEYDRFVFFLDDGTYRVIPVQDKYFIDGNILFCGVHDREMVFTAVYKQQKTGIAFIKRFCIGSFIMDKEYRFSPIGGEVVFFTSEPEMKLDFWFQRTKRMRRRKDECLISDYRVTSENAKGVQLCGKKIISSIKGVSLDDEEDDSVEPPVTDDSDEEAEAPDEVEDKEESLDEADETEPPSPEDVIKQAEDFRTNAAETLKRVEKVIHPDDDEDADDLFGKLD
ncbi:MAG: DNA topoisomerase IV subunit A [Candidatus Aegiribacteria sp.]|nr:DNA topoisomerase IV subunit A [Candidatus Aegiribacteria sp.]